MDFLNLRQTGSVEACRIQFEQLVYRIRLYDSSINETMLVSQFIIGLKDDIRHNVEMQLPESVQRAAMLALVQEQMLQRKRPWSKAQTPRHTSPISPAGQQSFTPSEMWKAKQLKEYRRLNHLCYKCGEKYSPAHKCTTVPPDTPPAQLHTILADVGDGGGILSDAMLDAIECSAVTAALSDGFLSLNALTGSPKQNAVQLRALVNNQVMLILVDSWSSHTFLSASMLQRLNIPTTSMAPLSVKVANGEIIQCTEEVPTLQWWIQGHTFSSNTKVIPLGAYDLILGMDWLEAHNPMTCDWVNKWIQFEHQRQLITLQGVLPSKQEEITEISGKQLQKLSKGNDIWATAVLSPVIDDTNKQEQYLLNGIPMIIKELIHKFDPLFQSPTELPPSRVYDHPISLLPDAVPVNSKPYRYSPDQKSEIEKQVADMLRTGIVIPSLSPFASPVLLVKKKDGIWRFCVDYRKLNSVTIKNKFPMPIIDEFLDEIAGADISLS